jgi:cyclopropane fatty-acyl-phospholipid synthase-like methyltransferase
VCASFDVFVHFEPRLVHWYLEQASRLLKPGGVAVIHCANLASRRGWQLFTRDLQANLHGRSGFSAFGVMVPELLATLARGAGFEVEHADLGIIPRDTVAVLRKPAGRGDGGH